MEQARNIFSQPRKKPAPGARRSLRHQWLIANYQFGPGGLMSTAVYHNRRYLGTVSPGFLVPFSLVAQPAGTWRRKRFFRLGTACEWLSCTKNAAGARARPVGGFG